MATQRTESDLVRIKDALKAGEKTSLYEATLTLSSALLELEAWLTDDRQWRFGRPQNWDTLLVDFENAWESAERKLRTDLDRTAHEARQELQSARRDLRHKDSTQDESLRRRMHRASSAVKAALLNDTALTAAWSDLIDAEGPLASADAARQLLAIGALRGHAPSSLVSQLQDVLRNEPYGIAFLRGDDPPDDPDSPADASVEERLKLSEGVLTAIPRQGDVVVWLTYAFTPKLWPPILQVGDRLTLYDVPWLRSVVDQGGTNSYELPPEFEGNLRGLSLFLPYMKEGDTEEPIPRVAVRLNLGTTLIAEAESIARSSAEALVALAGLFGAENSPWAVEESYCMFINGKGGPSRMAAPAAFSLSTDKRVAISSDTTARVVSQNADRWGPHFPITDDRMTQAAHLLVWLHRAQGTWAPARLVLCDRVIERVTGWAGLSSTRRLVDDHLKLSWAINRMRSEVANCAWSAFNSLGSLPEPVDRPTYEHFQKAREEMLSESSLKFKLDERVWSVNPQGVAQKLDWLMERVVPGSVGEARLKDLRERMHSGQAAARWAKDLMLEFEVQEARSRRVRNVLVHGGPETDSTVEGALPFVESLAAEALYASVEGRLDGTDLVDFFLDRRAYFSKILRDLKSGCPPADALWASAK